MSSSVIQHKFSAPLETGPDQRGAFVRVPLDIEQLYGVRGRLPVRGALNRSPFRGLLAPYGGVHYLGINQEQRQAAGIKIGDLVDVVFERDDEPRTVSPPADFAEALQADPAAQAAWDKLSYSHRREVVGSVEEAKKPETRQRRIAQAIEMLVVK
jgi:hypothetical protein